MKRPLFLTGMMGCGKTTVGRMLAREQGAPLVDLDDRIERMFGALSHELFTERGEVGFRELEHVALRSLLAEPGFEGRGVVVATGGGAVLHRGSREAMDRCGVRVYLEVGIDELERRLGSELEADGQARPLLQPGPLGRGVGGLRPRIAELLAARGSIYRTGALCIAASDEPSAVVARIMEAVRDDAAQLELEGSFPAGRAALGSEAV